MKQFFGIPLFRRFGYPAGIVLLCGGLFMSCGSTAAGQSSEAKITALTVSVNSTEYDVAFGADTAYTISIPRTQTIPASITVTSISVSDKASGPAVDSTQEVSADGSVSLRVTAEDGSTATYTLTIVYDAHEQLPLTAAQVKITDGTKTDGTTKLPSHFMVFDISSTDTITSKVPVEFLLVKQGNSAPATLAEFRKEVSIPLTSSNLASATDHKVVMAYKSAMFPPPVPPATDNTATSLYLAHDSEGNYPLESGTQYTLYAVQPESTDTAPVSLGSFSTGTHVDPTSYTSGSSAAEEPGAAQSSGNFYLSKTQFFVFHALVKEDLALNSLDLKENNKIVFHNGNRQTDAGDSIFYMKTIAAKPGSMSYGILNASAFYGTSSQLKVLVIFGFGNSSVVTFNFID